MESNWFYHGNNIQTKIATNHKNIASELQVLYNDFYLPYQQALLSAKGVDYDAICAKVRLLNDYYECVEQFEQKFRIQSQSKLRSTILEEFNGYLFKDFSPITELQLDFFNKGIFAGLKLDHHGQVAIMTKDVDFCIGKKFQVKIASNRLELIIPIVTVEVKTYLDATMYNEVQFAMQTIKNAMPNVRTYLLAERNEVKADKIAASVADTPLDEIFVVRGKRNQQMDAATIFEYYKEICSVLQINLKHELKVPGRLFHP